MGGAQRLVVLGLVILGALAAAPVSPAADAPFAFESSPVPSAACFGGPCPVFVYKIGGGGGEVSAEDQEGTRYCRPTCLIAPNTPSDVYDVTFVAHPDGGSYLAGWQNCDSTSATSCTLNFLRSDYICVAFEVTGTPPPVSPCPPPRGSTPPGPDKVRPNTIVIGGPPRSTRSRRAAFRFRANESATFICKLDARPWLPCRSPKRYARLRAGWHTFRVRAVDRAGNIDRTPASRRWRIRA
jgi:hypothetical protein